MTRPSVSVVVCTFADERFDRLTAAIESVGTQTAPPAEVIVVVDGNPALLERSRRRFGDAAVLASGGPRGLSAARTTGAAAASGDVVAFLDDDAIAAPGWLERLTEPTTTARRRGGRPIEPVWRAGRPAGSRTSSTGWSAAAIAGSPRPRARPQPDRRNMSFRREVFDEVGGFRGGLGRVGARPSAARRRSCACASAVAGPTSRSCTSRPRSSPTPSRRNGARGATSSPAAGPRGCRRRRSRGRAAFRALSSERGHAMRVLPAGIARGIGAAAVRRDAGALGRAVAIAAGLAVTTGGYVAGSWAGGGAAAGGAR